MQYFELMSGDTVRPPEGGVAGHDSAANWPQSPTNRTYLIVHYVRFSGNSGDNKTYFA